MLNVVGIVVCCVGSLFFFAGTVSSNHQLDNSTQKVISQKKEKDRRVQKTILSSQLVETRRSFGRGPSQFQTVAR